MTLADVGETDTRSDRERQYPRINLKLVEEIDQFELLPLTQLRVSRNGQLRLIGIVQNIYCTHAI